MKRFLAFSAFLFCLLAQNAYSQDSLSTQASFQRYEYASIVVEYGEREQRISITDGFYKSNRFALKVVDPVVLQRQVLKTVPDAAGRTESKISLSDSTQASQNDRFKSKAPRADYQVRGEFDNTYVFRLLSEYQAIGWEVSMMEFGVGSKQLHGDKVMMIILRRKL
ncbi:MAG: hypothetical protein AAF927_02525 [Bacteroidota bacterium]